MARRDRSYSPDGANKRVRSSYRSSPRSPSPTRRQRPRYDDRDRDRDRDRDYRDRDRDRDRYRDDRYRDERRRDTYRDDRRVDRKDERRRSRSRSRERRDRERDREKPAPATPEKSQEKEDKAPEDGKKKDLKAKLEAWKKQREATKALDEAKAKAMALAGKSAPPAPAAAAPTTAASSGQLNRAALGGLGLKGLPVKPDLLKQTKASTAAKMDDSVETKRTLEKLEDMPAIDMTMVEGQSGVGDLEGDDDDEEANRMEQELKEKAKEEAKMEVDEDDVDPLDAFMSSVKEEVKKVNEEDLKKMGVSVGSLRARLDDQNGDEGPDDMGELAADELDVTDLNAEDILALAAKKVKKKELATVDHSRIRYEPFRKEFYVPPPDIAEMTDEEADLLRLELDGIKIRGVDCPRPVTKWSHFGLPASCLEVIKEKNYTAPTPIQAQAVPAIMSGRDVIGVAKTGSGKTIAFLLPMFRHIKDQRPLEQMEGPIAVIMTPTRELAVQIHRECKPFLRVLNLRAVCAYGGSPIKDQIADMKKGAEIIVCTPGRMIDLLTANSGRVTNLKRVTYLVLDEADRMFDMGFEPQVMKIVNNIRPDRQTVLFSATFPKQMDSLARKILKKPLEITVGGRSVVAPEIEQIVEVRPEETKFTRLLEILGQMYNEDPEARTLIFVDRQEAADDLLRELLRKGYLCMSLHGGKDQVDRDQTIADFKSGVVPIVIATSVAARGLDVKQLKLVINYDAPNHMEDYVHRAGRTGRAGNKGTCVTFITPDQERYSVDIYRALQASNAAVPKDLEEMANAFLDKVKAGKAHIAGSGFGGKGLDRLDKERDAKEKAERKAYGEGGEEEKAATTEETATKPGDDMNFGNFKVEVKRGPAPDSSKGLLGVAGAAAAAKRLAQQKEQEKLQNSLRAAEEAVARAGKDTPAHKQAMSVVAKLNAQLRAHKLVMQSQIPFDDSASRKADATEFHAIIPINDYPQKARWKVTNKETMVQLIDMTGASVTNKGIFYEAGKEPPPEGPPKLHLLIESNEEWRVEQAVREIKRLLLEASAAAIQAEMRNPTGTIGRYSVI
ncbi:P-loop containing nucleoside triphosphate hydrolase protein [Gloeophyllum trabeum ATCC 11539]|uniref:RNA helicase n=1 Tax=Gloeophyllum trabeum (strain ATCC 11539 / FP-39264 / Madison 617) TaxID=670483 RepID=S7QJ12_GLOTA|nr:P-loop containing nucleoside triphosphate hydrolase protein [Gloeophyllum trabeum ATCC 11539]EPQ59328.1 P-loop containing nucleoside triphosphate hydrolase protein [Gloeophyllum trabeum ATCC 11539]